MKKKVNVKVLVLSLFIVYAVAFVGSLFTSPNTGIDWYESIKPSITPPNWVFLVVWNILFFLIALSLYFSWTSAKKKEKSKVAWVFATNLILNILWSAIFFGLRKPTFAFVELLLLWISIILMISTTHKINKLSSYLLWPYLLWVTFAGVLNFMIAF